MKIYHKLVYRIILILISVIYLSSAVSCVYFNTFYNAQLFFDEAEELRAEKNTEILSNNISEKYKKVIEKSDIVINEHPKSRFYDNALLLKAKSHYYRQEYDFSESAFNTLRSIDTEKYIIVTDYWLALIKWKTGRPEPALEYLQEVVEITDNKRLVAQAYQSQADIYLELKQDSLAVSALEKAVDLKKNRLEKAQIYYRLAELTYQIKDYAGAINYYENLIKYSISNDQIMEANLKIVQRYRDMGDLERASNEIQAMLVDSEFSEIHPELKLELAKLKLNEDKKDEGITLLDEIVVEFPKTETSAEAFYILGEKYLLNIRDFEKADFYFKQVRKEAPASKSVAPAQLRIKEIGKYNKSLDYLKSLTNKQDISDSLAIDTSRVVLELYNLGELDAFHFDQIDTSIIHFLKIITDFPQSDLDAKSMYTLCYLYEQLEDSTQSQIFQEKIIQQYPDSEYAENIRLNNEIEEYGTSGFVKLVEAEKLYLIDSKLALNEYKNIADISHSEQAVRALLFIANEYDYKLFNPDSAAKYYSLITTNFPDSEQANFAKERLSYLTTSVTKK